MKRAPKPWPIVIAELVEACIAAAKDKGVRGRIAVYESEAKSDDVQRLSRGREYVITIRIPAAETVPARATRR